MLPCSLSKTRVGGFVLIVFALKNPGGGLVLTVLALKNPGRGFVLIVFCAVDLEEYLLARRAAPDCGGRRPKGYF